MSIPWSGIVARRLARQYMSSPAPSIEKAVSAMMGAHAQVASAAELSIGIRMATATRTDVRAAVADATLTKTIGPRGTVHLLPTAELGLWLGALDDLPTTNGLPAAARLDPDQLAAVLGAIGHALDGAELTAEELGALVVAGTGPWAADPVVPAFGGWWPRWRQAIPRAASAGVLAYGAGRGATTTYARPPSFTAHADGPAELVRKYLHSYGPATVRDISQWLAAPVGWVCAVVERIPTETVVVEGQQRLVNHGDTDFTDAPAAGIRLLPYFDPYVVGSHPRSALYPGAAADRALGRGQAGVFPVLLVDGVVGGVWHQKRVGARITVTVEPLRPLTTAQLAGLDTEVQRVARVMEGVPTFTVGQVTVGAHA